MKNETKLAVIYNRTATAEQDINYQTKQCFEFAKEQNYTIENVFIDSGKSGYDLKRQGLSDMFGYCTSHENEIDAVIVTKIDRLTRNVENYLNVINPLLNEYNIKLLFAAAPNAETPEDYLFRSISFVLEQKYFRTHA